MPPLAPPRPEVANAVLEAALAIGVANLDQSALRLAWPTWPMIPPVIRRLLTQHEMEVGLPVEQMDEFFKTGPAHMPESLQTHETYLRQTDAMEEGPGGASARSIEPGSQGLVEEAQPSPLTVVAPAPAPSGSTFGGTDFEYEASRLRPVGALGEHSPGTDPGPSSRDGAHAE